MKLEKYDSLDIEYKSQEDAFVLKFTHTERKGSSFYPTTNLTFQMPNANEVLKLFAHLELSPKLTKLLDDYMSKHINIAKLKDEDLPKEYKEICDAFKFACNLPKPAKKLFNQGIIIADNIFGYNIGSSKKAEYIYNKLTEKSAYKYMASGDEKIGYRISSSNPQFLDEFLTDITEVYKEYNKNSNLNF